MLGFNLFIVKLFFMRALAIRLSKGTFKLILNFLSRTSTVRRMSVISKVSNERHMAFVYYSNMSSFFSHMAQFLKRTLLAWVIVNHSRFSYSYSILDLVKITSCRSAYWASVLIILFLSARSENRFSRTVVNAWLISVNRSTSHRSFRFISEREGSFRRLMFVSSLMRSTVRFFMSLRTRMWVVISNVCVVRNVVLLSRRFSSN